MIGMLVGLLLRWTEAVARLPVGTAIVHAILKADLLRGIAAAIVIPVLGTVCATTVSVPTISVTSIAVTILPVASSISTIVSGLIVGAVTIIVVPSAIIAVVVSRSVLLTVLHSLLIGRAVGSVVVVPVLVVSPVLVLTLIAITILVLGGGLRYANYATHGKSKSPQQMLL